MSLTKPTEARRIFVVDEQAKQRREIKKAMWKALGDCEFAEAGSVVEARDVLRKEMLPFDLAIISIRRETGNPEEDGRDLAREITARNPRTAIIIVTALPGIVPERIESGLYSEQSFISQVEPGLLSERLQTEAKALLQGDPIRHGLQLQHEAMEQAEQAYHEHQEQWNKDFGGMFVLVRDGQVVAQTPDAGQLQRVLADYSHDERCRACVLQIPGK